MKNTCAVLTLGLLACASAHAAELTITVLDRSGKPLPDAVVQLDSSAAGARPPATAMEVTIAQEKLRFVPAVSVLPLGAKVNFTNLDSWDHHVISGLAGAGGVYLDSGKNTQMRLAGRVAGRPPSSEARSFTQPGAYLLGCHLHSSMRGHVFVADAPWAKLSAEDGRVQFADLPNGAARIRIWHADQLLEAAPMELQLVAGAQAITLPTSISPRRRVERKPEQPTPIY